MMKWIVVLMLVGCAMTGCRADHADAEAEDKPQPRRGTMDTRWKELGLPETGTTKILSDSDEHKYVAAYEGTSLTEMRERTTQLLEGRGYKHACTVVAGTVMGFKNSTETLGVRIDGGDDEVWLSVFDSESSEGLLIAVCVGEMEIEGETVKVHLEGPERIR